MQWQKQYYPERLERFAKNVFNIGGADNGIEALKQWYQKIGTPVTLSQGNIPDQDIPYLVDALSEIAKKFRTNNIYTEEMIRTVLEYAK